MVLLLYVLFPLVIKNESDKCHTFFVPQHHVPVPRCSPAWPIVTTPLFSPTLPSY